MAYRFDLEEFFPPALFDAITDVRATRPYVIEQEALARRQRTQLAPDGKLVIVAADHPGRHVTVLGSEPLRMGNRYEYLGRILRTMVHPECDGLMTTPDIIDDLFIVNHLVREAGGQSFLDDKLLVGCMQRGGLINAVFEMDDRFTSYTAYELKRMRLDAGKMMMRTDLSDPASGKTLQYCADAINELRRAGLTCFLEPLPAIKVDGVYKVDKSFAALLKLIGVATALGEGTSNTWLKVPYVENYAQAARATTLPMLVLGGDPGGDPFPAIREVEQGMREAKNSRGALIGRCVLFPGDEDPAAILSIVNAIVHQGLSLDKARLQLPELRGQYIDALK